MIAKLSDHVLALFLLALAIVVCAAVLTALHDPVPSWFELLAVGAAAGGVGAHVPSSTSTSAPSASAPSTSSPSASTPPALPPLAEPPGQ